MNYSLNSSQIDEENLNHKMYALMKKFAFFKFIKAWNYPVIVLQNSIFLEYAFAR